MADATSTTSTGDRGTNASIPGVPSDNTTLLDVVNGYASAGFDAPLHVEDDGSITCLACGMTSRPEDIVIESVRRLDGASDPDDTLAVLAIDCPACPARGTVTVHYGPQAEPGEIALMQLAADARHRDHVLPAAMAPGEDHQLGSPSQGDLHMSETSTSPATTESMSERLPEVANDPGRSPARSRSNGGSGLQTDEGRTTIADVVVRKIAGSAARQITGVHSMGSRTGSTFGAIREMVASSPSVTQGVDVEVGERQAAIDLDLVVEYGTPILDLAAAVRRNVAQQVSTMTGLEVTEVNINVVDVNLPDFEQPESRVQ